MLKAQVTVAGKGKAGGVVRADSESTVRSEAERLKSISSNTPIT